MGRRRREEEEEEEEENKRSQDLANKVWMLAFGMETNLDHGIEWIYGT